MKDLKNSTVGTTVIHLASNRARQIQSQAVLCNGIDFARPPEDQMPVALLLHNLRNLCVFIDFALSSVLDISPCYLMLTLSTLAITEIQALVLFMKYTNIYIRYIIVLLSSEFA